MLFLLCKGSRWYSCWEEAWEVTFGIYSIDVKGGDTATPPADVGIVIQRVEVLHDLGDFASACALSYPNRLKAFFEVLQKFFLQMDACRLSTKVQLLKNQLYEWDNHWFGCWMFHRTGEIFWAETEKKYYLFENRAEKLHLRKTTNFFANFWKTYHTWKVVVECHY